MFPADFESCKTVDNGRRHENLLSILRTSACDRHFIICCAFALKGLTTLTKEATREAFPISNLSPTDLETNEKNIIKKLLQIVASCISVTIRCSEKQQH
jgi:hypothetical protein